MSNSATWNADDPPTDRTETDEVETEEDAPAGFPWVTLAMQIAIVVIFVAMWRAGNGDIALVSQAFGAKDKQLIDAGQTWRFVTPIFLHASWLHLIVNSISLWTLGSQIERLYGSRKYFIIYMLAGIAGNLASYLRNPTPSLGASGAIFGLVGAGLIFPIRFRSLLPDEARNRILQQLFWVAAVNLGIGFSIQGMDNFAHMGGLVGGGFAALFLLPDALDDRPRNALREIGVWLGAALLFGVIVWAGRSQWRVYHPLRFVPTLVRYAPPEPTPWWAIAIPNGWTRRGTQWRQGSATFEFTDSVISPGIAQTVEQAAQKAQGYMVRGNINGREVRQVVLPGSQNITEYWLIDVSGRDIVLRLECPRRDYPAVQPLMYGVYATLVVLTPTQQKTEKPTGK